MSDHDQEPTENPEPTTPESPSEDTASKSSLMDVMKMNMKLEPSRTTLKPRTVKRLSIMGVSLVLISYGFYWFIGQKGDLQLSSDTSKLIAAIKMQESGAQAVAVDSSGKVTESNGYVAGKTDRDIAWDPKGNRLFFISDRKEESFHIFRWDPERNSYPDQKSIDRTGRSSLSFDAQDTGLGDLVGLVCVRGTVQEFTPKTAKSQQVMPPTKRAVGGEEAGSTSAFDLIYKRFGQSFKSARWFGERRYIAAIMSREEPGEALIIQDMQPDEKGNFHPPQLVSLAQKINMDVDPKSGSLVFTLTDVLPILDSDGKPATDPNGQPVTLPFKNAVLMFTPKEGKLDRVIIGASPNREITFCSPVVSPDGTAMMFLVGKYLGDGNIEVKELDTCPLVSAGIQTHTMLDQGAISDPVYSPNGQKIAYVKREGSKQAIFVADKNGSASRNLTGTSGDFAHPVFSPQYK